MSFHDISLKLSGETIRWVTSPPFELAERRRMSNGDPNNSSAVNMSVHSGTHIDAPFHFVEEGSTIDQLPLERFIGPALVYAVETERYITKEHVAGIRLDGVTRDYSRRAISGRGTENICPGTATWPLLDWVSSPGSMPLLL